MRNSVSHDKSILLIIVVVNRLLLYMIFDVFFGLLVGACGIDEALGDKIADDGGCSEYDRTDTLGELSVTGYQRNNRDSQASDSEP